MLFTLDRHIIRFMDISAKDDFGQDWQSRQNSVFSSKVATSCRAQRLDDFYTWSSLMFI